MRIAVGVMTVNRKVANYLPGTLASLRATTQGHNLSVAVCVGNHDVSHVPEGYDVRVIDDSFVRRMPACGPIYAINANMAYTYNQLERGPSADLYLVAEDDIQFSSVWLQKAISLAGMASRESHTWLATLCTSYHPEAFNVVSNTPDVELWRHSNPLDFWGQQALLYPPGTFRQMCRYTEACEREWDVTSPATEVQLRRRGDQAIKWFCQTNGVPLFASNPSLVKHVGVTSSWGNRVSRPKPYDLATQYPTQRFVP